MILLNEYETTFWSLLLFAGYLKAATSRLSADSDLYDCSVSIPNHEVFRLYNRLFTSKSVIAAYSVDDLINKQAVAAPIQLTSRYSKEDIYAIY